MRKTELHNNQEHGENNGKTNVEKERVQQLSENMSLKLTCQTHQRILEEASQPSRPTQLLHSTS